MIPIILAIFAIGGGIGCIALADPAKKALGALPIALWLTPFAILPTTAPAVTIKLGTIGNLAIYFASAVLGGWLFENARSQQMRRLADAD